MNNSIFYHPKIQMAKVSTKSIDKTESNDDNPWKHYSLNMESSLKHNEDEQEKGFRSIKFCKDNQSN